MPANYINMSVLASVLLQSDISWGARVTLSQPLSGQDLTLLSLLGASAGLTDSVFVMYSLWVTLLIRTGVTTFSSDDARGGPFFFPNI